LNARSPTARPAPGNETGRSDGPSPTKPSVKRPRERQASVLDESIGVMENTDDNAITTPVAELLSYTPIEDRYYKIFRAFTNSSKNLTTIMKALAIYEKNKNANDGKEVIVEVIDDLVEEDGSEYEEVTEDKYAGNIHLKSIVFISPNYWTIWINDEKISSGTNKEEESEFFVEEVEKDRVKLVRRFSKGQWRYVNSGNYVSADRYKTNEKINKVELVLVLHPNQTFVLAKDEIIDGKYKEEVLRVENIESLDGVEGISSPGMSDEEINFDDLLNNL
jgi:hypothetical protein